MNRQQGYALFVLVLTGCFAAATALAAPPDRPRDVDLPGGYKMTAVARDLNFPTSITFDDNGVIFLGESGFAGTTARIVRVKADGTVEEVATGFQAPLIDVKFHDGWLYVSHQGMISRVHTDGSGRQDLITGLPSLGDHSNAELTFGEDGKMYFTVGTATNSGVVGLDNFAFGWVPDHPTVHDVPCQDIRLHAVNYTTPNPLTSDANDQATTGAFLPFGTAATEGQLIVGQVPCNGAILRANADGTGLELFAWGFRNPFGIRFDENGQLWATNNGMDERGSRPVENDQDYMFMVNKGDWYGWPDYSNGRPVNQETFAVDGVEPQLVLAEPARPLSTNAEAFAVFDDHVSANKFDFSTNDRFGFNEDAFVAETGSFPPVTGAETFFGYRVTRVNMRDGSTATFLANKSGKPAFVTGEDGINKPIDVKFDPRDGEVMYVVDFGIFLPAPGSEEVPGGRTEPHSGVLWAVGRRNSLKDLGPSAKGPGSLALGRALPNPARGGPVDIEYETTADDHVQIAVFDVSGRLVRTVVDEERPAGHHVARWDGRDEAGRPVAKGAYFYRMSNGREHSERKVLLVGN